MPRGPKSGAAQKFYVSLRSIILIGVGGWLVTSKDVPHVIVFEKFLETVNSYYRYTTFVFMGVGVFAIVADVMCTFAAVNESRCFIGLSILLVAGAVLVEAGIGVFAFTKMKSMTNSISEGASKVLEKIYPEVYNTAINGRILPYMYAMDRLQHHGGCCGIDSPDDWNKSRWLHYSIAMKDDRLPRYPRSCCPTMADIPSYTHCYDEMLFFTKPCKRHIIEFLNKYRIYIASLSFGIAALDCFGILVMGIIHHSLREIWVMK